MACPAQDLSIPLFDGLSHDEVREFLGLATQCSYGNDEVIISEGQAGDAIYVVTRGWVRVEKATIDQKQELLTCLGPGECFGELSLVDREPRSATVRAAGRADGRRNRARAQELSDGYSNAADAMEQGKVVTTSRFDEVKRQVVVEVEDGGPGMPEEVRERVFDSGFSTKDTAHGFGLAICRRIVENHNGTISVATQPEKGTRFTLTFPVSDV